MSVSPPRLADDPDRLLTPAELRAITGWSDGTIKRMRRAGTGPAVCWIGPRSPRYRAAEVAAWIESRPTDRPVSGAAS